MGHRLGGTEKPVYEQQADRPKLSATFYLYIRVTYCIHSTENDYPS